MRTADDSVPTVMAANDVECRSLAFFLEYARGDRKDGRVCHQDCSLLPLSRLWRGGALTTRVFRSCWWSLRGGTPSTALSTLTTKFTKRPVKASWGQSGVVPDIAAGDTCARTGFRVDLLTNRPALDRNKFLEPTDDAHQSLRKANRRG